MGGAPGQSGPQPGGISGRGVKLRFRLLPWQVQARKLRAERPLIVANCGVYTGKTVWGACELLDDMLHNPGKTFWWVAGLKFQLDAWWETFAPWARDMGARLKTHPYMIATLPNGARVYGVSAENVEIISAHHPVAIYGDEVAKWRERAWQLVRVRLLSRGLGRGLFLSTPRPNFWREMVSWGRNGRDGRWGLVECTTLEAGMVTKDQIEALRRDLPEELYQQEILARLVEGGGTVFRKVREAAVGAPEGPAQDQTYVIGYDPAKLRDFAVAAVRCEDRIVWVERWSEMDYLVQADRIAELANRYNRAVVNVDAGGPGEPIAELLQERKVKVERVTFTSENKEDMVNRVSLLLEQGNLLLPNPSYGPPYDDVVDELSSYERRRTASGLRYSYSAPEGLHDDCVSALMLCTHDANPEPAILTYYRMMAQKVTRVEDLRPELPDRFTDPRFHY